MSNYMDEAMREVDEETRENERMNRYYRTLHLHNLVNRGESMKGHLAVHVYKMTTPIPPELASGQENYTMTKTIVRRRFSKEIAKELLALHGDFAHFKALEELQTEGKLIDTQQLWRDVLLWLDELKGEDKCED